MWDGLINKLERKFEQMLLEAIDEAFSSLGESVKTSIYYHLEHTFALPRKDIPCRVDDFSDALERIFGLGARHLELLIMKKLHAKVSCQYRWEGPKWLVPDLTFRKYVELVKLSCEDARDVKETEVLVFVEEKEERL